MGVGGISLADASRAKPSVSAHDWEGRVRDLAQFNLAIDSTWPGPAPVGLGQSGHQPAGKTPSTQSKMARSVSLLGCDLTWWSLPRRGGEGPYHGVVEGRDLPAAVLQPCSSGS